MKSLLVATCGALLAVPAFAMTLTVTTTRDGEDTRPGDGVCSDNAGRCSLRAAVEESNASSGPDVIRIPSGTYRLTQHGSGEDTCATGDLDVTDDVTFIGAGADATVIDGDGADRVFDVLAANFVGMTVRNGRDPLWGAGIAGGYVTLLNTRIAENDGLGIASDASVSVESSTIVGNSAGGIDCADGAQVSDSVVAANGTGAGIAAPGAVVLRSIVESHATCGIMVYEGVPFGNASIVDSTVRDNATGICSGACSSLDLEGCTIRDNDVGLEVSQCFGFQVANSTISNNRGDGFVVVDDFGGYGSSLESVTVADNGGYGVRVASNNGGCAPIVMHDSILAGNGSGECGGACPLTSAGFNMVWDDSSCCLDGDPTGNLMGIDPQLDVLAANGGPTETRALTAGSAAIDAGDPARCASIDQQGNARPQGERCDIGAYESLCAATPRPECVLAERSHVRLRDSASPKARMLSWRWLTNAVVPASMLGDPRRATGYALCTYDRTGGASKLVQGLLLAPGEHWSAIASGGLRLRTRGETGGQTSLELRAASGGGLHVRLAARGSHLTLPKPATRDRFFAQEPSVTIQLLNSDGNCWTAEYLEDGTSENGPASFCAKAP